MYAGRPGRAHPLLDEIVGRLDGKDEALACLTVAARQLRTGRVPVATVSGLLGVALFEHIGDQAQAMLGVAAN